VNVETLDQFFDEIYRPIRLRGRSSRTVDLYRASIRMLSRWLGRDARLDDLEDSRICRYLLSLEDRLSPYSIAKERSQLCAMWNCAARRKFIDRFPDVPSSPLPRRVPIAWTEEELTRLIAACQRERGSYDGVPAGRWWVALHRILWDTGERIGAAIGVEWSDLRADWLIVRAELRKGKRADVCHRLAADTMESLDSIRLPARKSIFPWPYSPSYLWHVYGLILDAAWLPNDRKHKFHCMRKSVASHLKAAGGDPQLALGHTDPRTTAAYLDPRIVDAPQPADLLFRLAGSDDGGGGDDGEPSIIPLHVSSRPAPVSYDSTTPRTPETSPCPSARLTPR